MAKILIVDDNKDIVGALEDIMKKMKLDYDSAYSGEEFLLKVEDCNPDLVLLDVMMPGMTTKEILQQLKKKKLGKLKIILVTVVRLVDQEIKQLSKEAKIVDYILKPFSPKDLMKNVKKHLGAK